MLRQIVSKIQERVYAAFAAHHPSSQTSLQEPEMAPWDKPGAHFISTRDLVTMIGLSRSTIDNLEIAGQFPKRIKLTEHCVCYKIDEIREWGKAVVGVSDTDADGLLATVRQFAIDAEAWIKTHHPQLA